MQGFWKYEQRYLCQWILQRARTGLHVPGALMLVGFLFPTTVSQCVFQKTPAPDTKESGQDPGWKMWVSVMLGKLCNWGWEVAKDCCSWSWKSWATQPLGHFWMRWLSLLWLQEWEVGCVWARRACCSWERAGGNMPLSGLSCAGSIASDKLCLCCLQWERGSHGAGGDCKMVFVEKRSTGVCLIKQLQLHRGSRISRLLVVKRMKLENKKSLCVWYKNYRN